MVELAAKLVSYHGNLNQTDEHEELQHSHTHWWGVRDAMKGFYK